MKSLNKLLQLGSILVIVVCLVSLSNLTKAQDTKEHLKIGTYDSRVIVFAFSRSDSFERRMIQMRHYGDSINLAKDTAKMIEDAYKSITFQNLLHLQVFSTGSTAEVMNIVKAQLPKVAKEAGVNIILSKWELTFADPSAEEVDLTMPIAKLFNPKENIEKMAAEIQKNQPLPIEDVTVEEVIQMWKGFESKYLGKH